MNFNGDVEGAGEDHVLGEEGDDGVGSKEVDEVDVFVEKNMEDS